ncbi:MAG: glycosyltransferase family 4 protein, partial [Planctomycetaceae bacterium]|nr:glycosyltransferase family 4 protein [Planctomycetaceae bacterium]
YALFLPLLAARKALIPPPSPTAPLPFYQNIEADLFLTFGVQSNSATVIASAHATGRPAVLFLGSDSDLDERYAKSEDFVSVYRDRADVCRWVIDNADRILCQTERQLTLLKERFGRDGAIVRNPIDVDRWTEAMAGPIPFPELESLTNYALWVGRADPVHKRPQFLIELAKQCPQVPFVMVLNPRDDPTEAEVRRTAPGNVSIIRSVPFDQMPTLFARAAVLVNTSSLEGFPNTYLQAAISKVPVASLVVEEAFLRQSTGGICTHGDLAKLASYIQNCAGGNPLPANMEHARTFVSKEFGLTEQAKRLASELRRGNDVPPNS